MATELILVAHNIQGFSRHNTSFKCQVHVLINLQKFQSPDLIYICTHVFLTRRLCFIRLFSIWTSPLTTVIFAQQKVRIFLNLEEMNACLTACYFTRPGSMSYRHGAKGYIEMEKVKTTIQETLASEYTHGQITA